MKQDKIAAVLWSIGSLSFFVCLLIYVVVYHPSPGSDADKTTQLLSQWSLVSIIWRVETVSAILLAISSAYFAISQKSIFWILVSFAHLIMITMYAHMLGAYPTAAELYTEAPFLFPMVNNTAIWIFSLSNLLFLSGIAGIYYSDQMLKRWLAVCGCVVSLLGFAGMLALFLGLVSFAQIAACGLFITLLYLLNAYLGLRIAREQV